MFLSICLAILNLELFESLFLFIQVFIQRPHDPHIYYHILFMILWYILLYILLYLYYIWYRLSCLSKSILLFEEMAKYHPLHHLVMYIVSILWIYSYLVIFTLISCNGYYIIYLSYLLYCYIYIIIETLFTPPSQLSSIFL